MLAFLLDEHLPHSIAEQVRVKRPDIRIESVLKWREGELRQKPDALVLSIATTEGLTLVTYDQRTIPPILVEKMLNGEAHAGVIFVDRNAIRSNDIGGLVKSLISFYDLHHERDPKDTVMFLSHPAISGEV